MTTPCKTCGSPTGKHHIVCPEFKRQLEMIHCKKCGSGYNKSRRSCPYCGEVKV